MNNIIKRIEIDLYSPTSYEIIKAQQGDNHSRILEFVLLNNGNPYTISNNILIKMEGHRGDHSSFPPKDCTAVNNIITAKLDNDILYEPGTVEAKIVMYDKTDDSILSTIPFKIHVQKNPYDKNKLESEKQSAIDWLILNLEKLKSSFEDHISDFLNPHKVSKSQVGLGNVPNVTTNDQTPTYTEAASTTKLVSGEKLSTAFGKISKAVSDLLLHLSDNICHITSSERTNWNNAHNNSHAHGNKSILDKITQNLLDHWNAAHTHISDSIKHITSSERTLWNTVGNKVDKVAGKGLSTNDYTTADKIIVTNISRGSVTGIKGSAEGDIYHTGNVTISPSDLGIDTDSYALRKTVSSGDFDNMTTPGLYTMRNGSNSPSGNYHGLIVLKSNESSTTDFVEQIAFSESSFHVYVRYRNSNGWSSWKEIITEDNLLNKTYPIGSIYMSVNSTSPATLFGGTWVRWGNGRIPIGVDTSQTEFNTVGKTGGEKTHVLTEAEMPQHSHSISAQTVATTSNGAHSHTLKYSKTANTNGTGARVNGDGTLESYAVNSNGAHTHNVTIPAHNTDSKGSGTAHNNLPPYITCYMWKRTA